MNRSQCPVAKIPVYKIVHEFSFLMAHNFASEPCEPTKTHLPLKGGKFEIDRDGLKGAENFSVHSST
jgi:hypothetical protein